MNEAQRSLLTFKMTMLGVVAVLAELSDDEPSAEEIKDVQESLSARVDALLEPSEDLGAHAAMDYKLCIQVMADSLTFGIHPGSGSHERVRCSTFKANVAAMTRWVKWIEDFPSFPTPASES